MAFSFNVVTLTLIFCLTISKWLEVNSLLHIHRIKPHPGNSLHAKKSASTTDGSANHHEKKSDKIQSFSVEDPRVEALADVLQQIERNYGKGSIVKLGESNSLDIARTPSGSYSLDLALGGGYPVGRVIEIYGPESSGKTTLALHAIAEVQKNGGTAAFIDVEHALDPVYAESLGVKVGDLYVTQPDSGEMALDIVDKFVRSSAVDIIIVDSVAALAPRAELEGDMGDQQPGLQARLMSRALRKITSSMGRSQTTVIFLNQLRSKVGVMYGSPEVTSGGNALKFYSSVRLDIRRKEVLANGEGVLAKVKVVKNKVFPPYRVVELEILFGSGINKLSCLIDAAEALKLIDRKGSWYSYGEVKLGQGRKQSIDALMNDPKLLSELDSAVSKQCIVADKIVSIDESHQHSDSYDFEVSEDSSEIFS